MQSEQGGHHRAAADVACRLLQHPEQQDHIQGVQYEVDVMVSGWIELEELDIRGVRQPGYRMPVGRGVGGKRPRHRAPVQSGLHMEVVEDVVCVVVVGEWLVVDRVIQGDGCDHQEKAEYEFLAAL